jgi:hypothetical protein
MSRRSQTAHNPARDEPAPSGESQDISGQSTLGERVSEAGSAATQAVRDTGEAIADRVGAAGKRALLWQIPRSREVGPWQRTLKHLPGVDP